MNAYLQLVLAHTPRCTGAAQKRAIVRPTFFRKYTLKARGVFAQV